jgi:hypothetical protein
MALSQEGSLFAGLALTGATWAAYSAGLPHLADLRQVDANNADVEKTERLLAWVTAGSVVAVSLIAKDPGVFIIGGIGFIAVSYLFKHANAVSPSSGTVLGDLKMSVPGAVSETPVSTDVIYLDEAV